VRYFSKRPQLQEQLTQQIGDFLRDLLSPRAIFVEVEAQHQCVMCRGAESDCSTRTFYRWYSEDTSCVDRQEMYEDFCDRM